MNSEKIAALRTYLQDEKLDAAILTNWHDVAYLSGFESDPIERVLALVLFADHDPFLFGPALEVNAMQESGWPFAAYGYDDHENPWALIGQHVQATTTVRQVAIESDDLSVARYNALQTALPAVDLTHNIGAKINFLRLVKTPDEIQKMQRAGQGADLAVQLGMAALHVGVTEREVTAEIEYQLKKQGISGMSFDSMVQFGDHAADSHGAPSNRQLKANELVLFDLGTMADGYASDTTRTVAFGTVSAEARAIYDVVLEAQLTAQAAATIGMTAAQLDAIARDVITKAGYGEYFTHRLGHGLGASVHEFPSIMAGNDLVLTENMVFSIEPGIYIPGVAGVRIEDCVVLSQDGAQPLTHNPKTLQTIQP
jgi:Xaa-Pro dipeptidase